ncbi:MAG TPA: type II toxin-antitoxin system VapC family toxin [Thermoanaerobaculia bacterium]|nr:type II toxin-antitoxin system VapC family toxin [Thermoanaerobaculia bacterium]
MRAVDTNILVRLVTRDDQRQLATAESYIERGAWVSTLVLAETSWVLGAVYDLGQHDIATVVEMLLSHEHLSLQDPEVVVAALEQYRKVPALGFSDCLVLEIARKAGHLPLGTFDKRLANVDGAERL